MPSDSHTELFEITLYFRKLILLVCFSFLFLYPEPSKAQLIPPNSPAIETSGDIILYSLPASALATTFLLKDRKGTWQFAKGFVVNSAVTLAVKYGINKPRPFDSGFQAFPSGHTSITFQAASFIHLRYGWEYGIPAYILSSWTGYSRINATRHDGYDVLAGAVVGIGSSLLFTKPYEDNNMQLTFSSGEDSWLIGFNYTF